MNSKGGAEVSVASGCAGTHMKHVRGEWAQAFDLGTSGRGLHYAIAALVLILIGWEERDILNQRVELVIRIFFIWNQTLIKQTEVRFV